MTQNKFNCGSGCLKKPNCATKTCYACGCFHNMRSGSHRKQAA
ncbi:hypothetical protein [Alysiella filiformis]|nr:hypothetical protein [Alysiella filiformis]